MRNTADVNFRELAELLRNDRLIHDAEVISGPAPATITAFIVSQGFRPGYVLRPHVMRLAGDMAERLQIVLVKAIPRDGNGSVDPDGALAAIRRPGAVFRFERPATETERLLLNLVVEVLPGRQVSMTDSLAALGGDSLAAIELATLISERLGIQIDPHLLFRAESLGELAKMLPSGPEREPE